MLGRAVLGRGRAGFRLVCRRTFRNIRRSPRQRKSKTYFTDNGSLGLLNAAFLERIPSRGEGLSVATKDDRNGHTEAAEEIIGEAILVPDGNLQFSTKIIDLEDKILEPGRVGGVTGDGSFGFGATKA